MGEVRERACGQFARSVPEPKLERLVRLDELAVEPGRAQHRREPLEEADLIRTIRRNNSGGRTTHVIQSLDLRCGALPYISNSILEQNC